MKTNTLSSLPMKTKLYFSKGQQSDRTLRGWLERPKYVPSATIPFTSEWFPSPVFISSAMNAMPRIHSPAAVAEVWTQQLWEWGINKSFTLVTLIVKRHFQTKKTSMNIWLVTNYCSNDGLKFASDISWKIYFQNIKMFNQTFSPDRPIIFPATWSTGKTQL